MGRCGCRTQPRRRLHLVLPEDECPGNRSGDTVLVTRIVDRAHIAVFRSDLQDQRLGHRVRLEHIDRDKLCLAKAAKRLYAIATFGIAAAHPQPRAARQQFLRDVTAEKAGAAKAV